MAVCVTESVDGVWLGSWGSGLGAGGCTDYPKVLKYWDT